MEKLFKTLVQFMFILVLALSQIRCQDEGLVCVPVCLTDIIANIAQDSNTGWAGIAAYKFQNQVVYYIDPGHYADDQAYEVQDADCKLLGLLEGFVGNRIIHGDDFYKKAKFIGVVWEK